MSLNAAAGPDPGTELPPAAPASTRLLPRVEAVVVIAAALLSLAFYLRLPRTLPSEADWQAAGAHVESIAAEGDVVLLSPHWAERARLYVPSVPVLNLDRRPTREDLARHRRVLLLALPELPRADEPEVRAFLEARQFRQASERRAFGRLALTVFENTRVEAPVYDFTARVADARVFIRRPDGSEEHCPRTGERHPCPRAGWINVAAETKEIAFKPYRCLWAHPAGTEPLVISYPAVTLGRELRVMGGIVGQIAFKRAGYATTTLDVFAGGRKLGDLAAPAGTVKEHRRVFDTSSLAGETHEVRFEVHAPNPHMRHFCFDAGVYP